MLRSWGDLADTDRVKRVAIIAVLSLTTAVWAQLATTQPISETPPPSTPILREGSYIVDRVGRLGHSGDNQQPEFIFARGQDPRGEKKIMILPNLNLMLMEDAVASDSEAIHFKITGMVTEYRGKNYVLLEKVVVVPKG